MELEAGLGLEAFAERIAARIRARHPVADVDYVQGDARSLEVRWPDGGQATASLDNLWRAYRQSGGPALEPELTRWIEILAPLPEEARASARLVALVRPATMLVSALAQTGGAGRLVAFPLVAEELFVVLARDCPDRIELLTVAERNELGQTDEELFVTAVRNVLGDLSIQRHGDGPVWMLTAGGNYEASLLLHAGLWRDLASEVQGELLASVPCRDLIYYTGSDEPGGPELLARITERMHRAGSYPISSALLHFTGSSWELAEPEVEEELDEDDAGDGELGM